LDDTSFLFHKVSHFDTKLFNTSNASSFILQELALQQQTLYASYQGFHFYQSYFLTIGLLIACQIKRQGPHLFNN